MTFLNDLFWFKKRGYSWKASVAMAKMTIHFPATVPDNFRRYEFFQDDRIRHRKVNHTAI